MLQGAEYEECAELYRKNNILEALIELEELKIENDTLTMKLRKYRNQTSTHETGDSMIEVGKVVIKLAKAARHIDGLPLSRGEPEESIAIVMAENYIGLHSNSNRPLVAKLNSAQAIELAQLLMKAAECQTEYADAAKDLDAQRKALDAKYKDMISGLGLENPDLQAKNLAVVEFQSGTKW